MRTSRGLVAVWAVLGLSKLATAQSGRPGRTQDAASAAAQDAGRRPFQHQRHEELPCRGCHGSGATHRVTRVRTARDCATCHHDAQRALSCEKCHSSGALGGARQVTLSIAIPSTGASRTRVVDFQHAPHIDSTSRLVCRDCHAAEVMLTRTRQCESCHDEHHAGRAECTTCHAAPPEDAHKAAVHLGCAGASCHSAARAPAPALSRTLCLFCHAPQRDHEPGGSCALCHRIPGARVVPGSPTGVRSMRGVP